MAKIIINPNDSYSRRYKIRFAGKGRTLETCLPIEYLQKEARKRKLSLEQFVESFEAEFFYDGVKGMFVRFVEKDQQ